MKKIYFVLLFCAVTSISIAQLKVASTGKVGVNIGTSTPLSNVIVFYPSLVQNTTKRCIYHNRCCIIYMVTMMDKI
jgi:hypothetical protein